MIPYQSRIPVENSYLQALGQVIYNHATVEWNIVYLGSLVAPSFLVGESGAAFEDVVKGFEILSEVGKFPEFQRVADRFRDLTTQKNDLLKSVPITASNKAQILDGSENGKDKQWTEDEVWSLAKQLEELDIDANGLYYRLKQV